MKPQFKYELSHIYFNYLIHTHFSRLPMRGFIAQMVEHRTGISRRLRVRIPLKPWFFQASSFKLLNLENLAWWSFLTFITLSWKDPMLTWLKDSNTVNKGFSYPTVVIEIKDHQNPSQEPLINERGNSSLFQYVSYVRQLNQFTVRCFCTDEVCTYLW